LATKGAALPAVDAMKPKRPKVQLMCLAVTPSTIIVAEEKTSSTKPVMIGDKGNGPQELKRPKRLSRMTHRLVKGLLIKSLEAENTYFIMLLGRLWAQSSWLKLLAFVTPVSKGQSRVHSICVPGSISTHMLTSQV
jgi:hypothetical protein